MQSFSTRLISLRKERGLTQEDIAKITNKKRSTISGYETEGKEPDLETICLLAKCFDVSTDYLIGVSNQRRNADVVFLNDDVNFKKHYEALPDDLKPTVASAFDSFYLLLNRDMQYFRGDRLQLCQKLISTIQQLRAEVRNRIERPGANLADAAALSDLMAMQNHLKSSVSAILDELMQADMEGSFSLSKRGRNTERPAM